MIYNVGSLLIFKYTDFFIGNVNNLFNLVIFGFPYNVRDSAIYQRRGKAPPHVRNRRFHRLQQRTLPQAAQRSSRDYKYQALLPLIFSK